MKCTISTIKEVFKTDFSDNIKLEIIKFLIHYLENNNSEKFNLLVDLIKNANIRGDWNVKWNVNWKKFKYNIE